MIFVSQCLSLFHPDLSYMLSFFQNVEPTAHDLKLDLGFACSVCINAMYVVYLHVTVSAKPMATLTQCVWRTRRRPPQAAGRGGRRSAPRVAARCRRRPATRTACRPHRALTPRTTSPTWTRCVLRGNMIHMVYTRYTHGTHMAP